MAEGGVEENVAVFPEEGVSDEVRAPACQTHNEPIEFYCQTHSMAACGSCKLMDHRKCQLQDLENAAACSTGKTEETFQQLRAAESNMKKTEKEIGSQQEALEAQQDEVIEQIQRKIKEIEDLGQRKIAEVKDIFKKEHKALDREAHVIKKSTMLVERSIKELERATKVGSNEEIFLATRQAEDDVSKFHDIVRESSQMPHTEMHFEMESKLTDITSIGTVCVEKSTISVDHTPEVTMLFHTQETTRQIRWLDVLPSEQMILLVYDPTSKTNQLRLYSANMKVLSQLDLPRARSADTLNDHQIIVALIDLQQLQIVNMDNDNLTKGLVINTNMRPFLILKYSDTSVLVLFVTYSRSDATYYFQILELTGKVEKHVKLDISLDTAVNMKMNLERNTVYIVGNEEGCLGVNLKGDRVFHYRILDCNIYFGLAVDPHGALYFSAKKRPHNYKCMTKLSPAGQVLGQIDIKGTYPLQCVGNKLYVAGRKDQDEWIISFFYV